MVSVHVIWELVQSYLRGVADVLNGVHPLIKLTQENEKLRVPLFRCVLLNGLILLVTVLLFEWFVLPVIEASIILVFGLFSSAADGGIASQVGYLIWYLFAGLWVLPLFWISKPLNAFWFQDIANEAFKRKTSLKEDKSLKTKQEKSIQQSSLVYVVADILFSLVMDMLFMMQSTLVGFIPIVGYPLSVVHQVLLISLYAFEYRCYSEGLANCKYRIYVVEGNLAYFLGFGTPLALLMLIPSSYIVSTCCFALLFPLSIVSAYEAKHIDFLEAGRRSVVRMPVFDVSARLANEVTTFVLSCLLGIKTTTTTKTKTNKSASVRH